MFKNLPFFLLTLIAACGDVASPSAPAPSSGINDSERAVVCESSEGGQAFCWYEDGEPTTTEVSPTGTFEDAYSRFADAPMEKATSEYGDDAIWRCGIAGMYSRAGGTMACAPAGQETPGLYRDVTVAVNCVRRVPKPTGAPTVVRRYTWTRCETGVTHPSGGEPEVLYAPYSCYLINGICRVPSSLPPTLLPGDVDVGTPEGAMLANLYDRLVAADTHVRSEGGPNLAYRLRLLDAAGMFLGLAETALLQEEYEESHHEISLAARALDLATDFVPGVSLLKDLTIVSLGINPATGESVSDIERAVVTATLALPGFLKGGAHTLEALADGLRTLSHTSHRGADLAGELYEVIRRADDALEELVGFSFCGTHQKGLCSVGRVTSTLASDTLTSGTSRGILVGKDSNAIFFASEDLLPSGFQSVDNFVESWRGNLTKAFGVANTLPGSPGSATTLRSNMAELLGVGRTGLNDAAGTAAHHIIPRNLIAETGPARDVLRRAGFSIDAPANGILLPGAAAETHILSRHAGSHENYSKVVTEYLAAIDASATRPIADIRADVARVMERAVRVLTNGSVSLHQQGLESAAHLELLRNAFEQAM